MKRQTYHIPTGYLRDRIRANCLAAINAIPADQAFAVEIKPPPRSLPQNSRWHAMAGELGRTVGYTQKEMERAAKDELGRYTDIQTTLGTVRRYQSSRDWAKDEMTEAIDLLIRWGAEVGHRWRVE